MTDLTAWLRSQLDADEEIARAATAGPWRRSHPQWPRNTSISGADDVRVIASVAAAGEWPSPADADHIICNDPVHALRTVAAHRAILDRYETAIVARDAAIDTPLAGATRIALRIRMEAVQHVASIYAERPGFDPSWRANG